MCGCPLDTPGVLGTASLHIRNCAGARWWAWRGSRSRTLRPAGGTRLQSPPTEVGLFLLAQLSQTVFQGCGKARCLGKAWLCCATVHCEDQTG